MPRAAEQPGPQLLAPFQGSEAGSHMNTVGALAHRVRAALAGAVRGVGSYPSRVRRGEATLPRPRDFRPTRPSNWSIRTRLLLVAVLPVAVVTALDGVTGHLNPITLVVLVVSVPAAFFVSRLSSSSIRLHM